MTEGHVDDDEPSLTDVTQPLSLGQVIDDLAARMASVIMDPTSDWERLGLLSGGHTYIYEECVRNGSNGLE